MDNSTNVYFELICVGLYTESLPSWDGKSTILVGAWVKSQNAQDVMRREGKISGHVYERNHRLNKIP